MVCGIYPTAARNVALSVRDIEVGPMKQNYKKTALISLIFLPSFDTNQWLAVVTLHLVGCVLFFWASYVFRFTTCVIDFIGVVRK